MAHPPHTELFHVYGFSPSQNLWIRSRQIPDEYQFEEALTKVAEHYGDFSYRIVSVGLGYNAYRWEGRQADAQSALDFSQQLIEAIDQRLNTQEEAMTPDLQQPLTIPRTTLIQTLQKNVDKLAQDRADAEAAEAERRKVVLDAIAELTPDELYNIFVEYYTVDVERLKNDHENKYFVTREVVPTKIETDTEKFIRVLGIASDENIEVTPNEELYRLL